MRRATYAATHDLFVVAISIHALREESDYKMGANKQTTTFQSTLSVRRATVVAFDAAEDVVISIHALREESDLGQRQFHLTHARFQSTLSVRRATLHICKKFPHS